MDQSGDPRQRDAIHDDGVNHTPYTLKSCGSDVGASGVQAETEMELPNMHGLQFDVCHETPLGWSIPPLH